MLVLSRKKNEKLVIGKDIVVTLIEITGDKVRLGIEAPESVTIWREEIVARAAEPPIKRVRAKR